jgi:hypothetical protein
MPEIPDPRLDYVLFSERPVSGGGLWRIEPVTAFNCSPTRASRYVKMHPHLLFPEYDLAIWIDANIMLMGEIGSLIDQFMAAPEPVAAIPHPHRCNIYEEIEACLRLQKDAGAPMREQVARYRRLGFAHDDLVEANFLMFKLDDARVARMLDIWWRETERGSKRDQLGFNFAMREAGINWHRMMPPPLSARSHPSFATVPHDNGGGPASVLLDALGVEPTEPYRPSRTYTEPATHEHRDVQVVVIASGDESALARSEAALAAAHEVRPLDVVVVGAEPNSPGHGVPWIKYMSRSRGEQGKVLDTVVASSRSDVVLLLQAGVVFGPRAIAEIVTLMIRTPGAGLVGPVTPDAGIDDGLLSVLEGVSGAYARARPTPVVPVLSGECLAVRREVIQRVGPPDFGALTFPWGWEVDYCFCAADLGFRSILATGTGCIMPNRAAPTAAVVAAQEILRGRHGRRRFSRALMTLLDQPILDRQNLHLSECGGPKVTVPIPEVLRRQRRRKHP